MLLLNEFLYISKVTILETHKIDLYLLKFALSGIFYNMKKTMHWYFKMYQALKMFLIKSTLYFQSILDDIMHDLCYLQT